jgi:hypothetical protein
MKFTSAILLFLGAVCAQQALDFDTATAASTAAVSVPITTTAEENDEEETRRKKRKSMTQ